MTGARSLTVAAVLVVALAACGGDGAEEVELAPPEVFTWTGDQPIAFAPPPETWRRSRYQNGGAEGVEFVLRGSKGEQIFVAERFFLGRRDRCGQLRRVLDELDRLRDRELARRLHEARMYAPEPFNATEGRVAEIVNASLDRVRDAMRRDDRWTARRELENAVEQAAAIRFTVEETVGRVLFTRERNPVYPGLEVRDPVPVRVAGEPALAVEFTFEGHGTPMVGRRIYVVENNRMFELGFQGLEETLPLFERVVDTVSFPAGVCEH